MSRSVGKRPATAATAALTQLGVPFETHAYDHDPRVHAYGDEAASVLDLDPASVFKTLVVRTDVGRFAVAIVPVSGTADLKAVAAALGSKKAQLAAEADVRRLTGYVLGGVSPFGQRTTLPTVVDDSASALPTIYVSGGRRGMDLALAPSDLLWATGAVVAAIAAPTRRA